MKHNSTNNIKSYRLTFFDTKTFYKRKFHYLYYASMLIQLFFITTAIAIVLYIVFSGLVYFYCSIFLTFCITRLIVQM